MSLVSPTEINHRLTAYVGSDDEIERLRVALHHAERDASMLRGHIAALKLRLANDNAEMEGALSAVEEQRDSMMRERSDARALWLPCYFAGFVTGLVLWTATWWMGRSWP